MRASQGIERLQKLMEEHGDCYLTRQSEDNIEGMESIEDIEVESYHETKYFKLK